MTGKPIRVISIYDQEKYGKAKFIFLIEGVVFIIMKEKMIRLATVDEVKKFVSAALQCDFDVDVCYNRIVIDAKSILGVFSLDLRNDLTVRMHGENLEFEELLDQLAPLKEREAIA